MDYALQPSAGRPAAFMRIFVTGATGFIGRSLLRRLRRDQHELTAWVRSEDRARDLLGNEVELATERQGLRAAVAGCDAVVNLAGETIFGRWSTARKERIGSSRIDLTTELVQAFEGTDAPPRVLVSGSAVGYYGARDADPIDENSAPGNDYLARVCKEWEATAQLAEAQRVRVVLLRTGIVLGRGGGVLAAMLPLSRLGLGGRLGSGAQYVSWIHLRDHVEAIVESLTDARYRGPINLTAPNPVTNLELTNELGHALNRTTSFPVPEFVLRTIFGEAADMVLTGQRALPSRLNELGFRHRFQTLQAALADLCDRDVVSIEPVQPRRAGSQS